MPQLVQYLNEECLHIYKWQNRKEEIPGLCFQQAFSSGYQIHMDFPPRSP